MPAEWEPQSAVQLTWPHAHTDWAPILPEITAVYEEMAREISKREGLLIVAPKELIEIHGIGTAKACSIIAAMELSKRLMSGQVMDGGRIANSEDISRFLLRDMLHEKREMFVSIHLDSRQRIESRHIVSIGSLDAAPVHPREVFAQAVKRGAAAVIVAHNHPSGDPTPSPQDIAVTRRLSEASHIIGISLLDHLIRGNGKCLSLRDEGYLTD